MQICKENFFYGGGEGTPVPESQIFLDILGKNLVIFFKFSRFKSVFTSVIFWFYNF